MKSLLSRTSAQRERPLASVPRWVLLLLACALVAQLAWQSRRHAGTPAATDLPPAPSAAALRLIAFGETAAFARLAMIWLQAFDSRGDNAIPYQRLDYVRLTEWLRAILAVDPRSAYPLFAAARIYAENVGADRARRMFDFIFDEFGRDPNARWPALAHAALLAKHRLNDLPLARRYAAAIQRQTTDASIPSWAKQMEIFILEDMNELEAAKIMLGGLLATGRIRDAEERRFLESRLAEIEQRMKGSRQKR